ncbi:MAG: tRNA 2-selenouridine(34) synthase MnmH [Desulfuromonadaceae bacterium]|nr:tRNA 2-selenouridine(34) synthase MnmH [Desulfuromonadaceae bacterium]
MTLQLIEVDEALKLRDQGALMVDVRSPSEFAQETIPGAINIPLLNDEERARVGTCYKQKGRMEARLLGLQFVSPRIPAMVSQLLCQKHTDRTPAVVFCWRGGLRSEAAATLFALAGISVRRLRGGHKAFRDYVRDFLDRGEWGRLLVLRGLTGVGKTALLKRLVQKGVPILDLEGIACHRGSAFGGLNQPPQPTQKYFEALLWDRLRNIPPGSWAVSEGESRNIGKLLLPERLYASLQEETSLWIKASVDFRVRTILREYAPLLEEKEALTAPIQSLRRRLGGDAVDQLLQLVKEEHWEELVRRLIVDYYDPLYRHTLPERRIEVEVEPEDEGMQRLRLALDRVLAEKVSEPAR